MSTHAVNVIEIPAVLPHTNAERLEIVPVNGWQAVVKKGQFKPGDRAIYIEPDYTVPTERPEFSFLAREGRNRNRLKAVRLRGALSFGLLIPVPDELRTRAIGDNVMAELGIERYEPPIKLARSDELPEAEWPAERIVLFSKDDLRAAIAAYEQALWRPIEEAPKDGTAILILCPDSEFGAVIAFWSDPIVGDTIAEESGWYASEASSNRIFEIPTHYRTLPPLPGKEG